MKSTPMPERLHSLDVYRGLIMITLAFTGFGLADTARRHLTENPESPFWQTVHYQFSHVEWTGCGYWDLIQPSFMFMVGVAMAFSYVKRQQLGQSYSRMFLHALARSLILIFLGIFLISNGDSSTNWSFMNVLTQIGLGYTFLFLLWNRPFLVQALAALLLLAGTWLLYTTFPAPDSGAAAPGVTAAWAQQHLQDIPAAWHKNANVGHTIDLWLLNLPHQLYPGHYIPALSFLPEPPPFAFNRGGYQTINFIPSLATMLFGLMCGELLRSRWSEGTRLLILIAAGTLGLAAGTLLDMYGICPSVKRIWTPSWALLSTGWCCLILALLYGVVDVLRWRWWTFPFIVVGMNSIAIYCMGQLLKPWVQRTWRTHLGRSIFEVLGDWGSLGDFEPFVRLTLTGLTFWVVCWWMYRNKIFVRI